MADASVVRSLNASFQLTFKNVNGHDCKLNVAPDFYLSIKGHHLGFPLHHEVKKTNDNRI